MKLEMTNLESLQACREATVIEEVVQIISHAPYDVFEQTISAHISQFIGYSPSLQFNTFGDVVLPLIELAEETNQTKIAYVFNWADVSPVFEMNSRQGEAVKEINEGVLLEKINEHISILKRVEENSNVNLVLFLPDINETYLAMGHVHEKANINIAYSHLLQGLKENSLTFELKTGGQNLSHYFKYHVYDDLKSLVSIAKGISSRFYDADYKVKAIFVDLDDTIWPSNIGDWEELPIISSTSNKTFHYFQTLLKKISSSGVLLVAVSKNDESYVIKKFDQIEMPLSTKDFYSISCSWAPKSEVIGSFIEQINILPEHCLFLDDNPAELLEVNSVLPNLKSIRVSKEISDFGLLVSYLQSQLTTSSSSRENKARKIIRPVIQSGLAKDYLKELSLCLKLHYIDDLAGRPLELINKTNQFNLNGIRLDDSKLKNGESAFTVELKDIYGDFGTVGVLVFSELDTKILVHRFVVSCRAFSRGVEFEMLHSVREAIAEKAIYFEYKKTDRNNVIGELMNLLTETVDGEFRLNDKLLEKKRKEYEGVLSVH